MIPALHYCSVTGSPHLSQEFPDPGKDTRAVGGRECCFKNLTVGGKGSQIKENNKRNFQIKDFVNPEPLFVYLKIFRNWIN